MMKRFGRGFISMLLIVTLLVSSFTILSVNAAADAASLSFSLEDVTGEQVTLQFDGTVNGTASAGVKAIMDGSGLTANTDDDYMDEYGIYGIDGYVKVRFSGAGDAIFGSTRETGLRIANGSYGYDIICNYIMEDGTFNYDLCTGCTIDKEAALIRIPAGETADLSFTTPKAAANTMYFTVLNFKAIGANNEYFISVVNSGPGTLTLTNSYGEEVYGEESPQVIPGNNEEYGYFISTYNSGIDFCFDNSENPNYECVGLVDDDSNFYGIDSTFRPTKSTSLCPLILDANTPLFKVDNKAFTDLNEAAQAAAGTLSKRVILVKDGVLTAGDYTLPEGVSLLIPFDEANTMYTSKPASVENAQVSSRFAYRTLTMEQGANIIVEDGGAISVSAKHQSTTTGSGAKYNGAVAGGYGWIKMEEGSSITLNGASSLYAWGYITGDGNITANSGSAVYEFFQINDFRGGTITSRMAEPATLNQFPLNQYYVQNIEAHLHINYGAVEYVMLELYAGGKAISFICSFIDKDDADQCMFRLKSSGSYLEKYYDYENDKMEYAVKGDADIDAITLSLSGVTISSADYYLPISNINVTIKEGSSLTTDKKVVFLPGSGVTVEEGASIVITSGEYSYIDNDNNHQTKVMNGSVIFAAKDDIGKYSASGATPINPCKPVVYTPTAHPNRTWANTKETFLDNNGSITIKENASLASTSEKAQIYSSTGNGTFVMEGDNATSVILTSYQSFNESTNTVVSDDVSVEPAIVHDTAESSSQADAHSTSSVWGIPATFKKIDGVWGDYRNVTWIDLDGSVKQTMNNVAYDAFLTMEQPVPQEKPADDFATYEYLYWVIDTVNGNEVTVIPFYKTIRENCTVTWTVDGAQYAQTSVEYGGSPTPPTSPTKSPDMQYTYTFAGWSSDGGTTVYVPGAQMPQVLDDITYAAVFNTKLKTYPLQFYCYDPVTEKAIGRKPKSGVAYGTEYTDLYTSLYGDQNRNLVDELKIVGNHTEDFAFIGWATGKNANGAAAAAKAKTLTFKAGETVFIDGSATFYYAVFVKVEHDYFANHSISLNGNIGVNYYITLPDGDNAEDYTVGHSFRGEYNDPVQLADLYDAETGMYKFTVNAEAPQMTDGVTAILYKNGTAVDADIYMVVDYSDVVFNKEDNEVVDNAGHQASELKTVLRTMLYYGAAAQEYFADKEYADSVNETSAAESIDNPSLVNYSDVTDEQLADAVSDETTDLNENTDANTDLALYGLKYYGVSSVLGTNPTLRIYFSITDEALYNASKNAITFGFYNEAATPVVATENGRYVYVEYAGIAPAKLDNAVTMKINGSTVIRYSVMDYLRKALTAAQNTVINNVLTPDAKLIKLVTAMYHYNREADRYFG